MSFWQTLEELPQRKSDRLDWRQRLTGEWPAAERLLRRTGRLVNAVACPSPGGDGCPRRIVRHADGRIVAVCGDRPQRCEKLDLQADDIEVLELDEPSLRSILRRVLALDDTNAPVSPAKLMPVGMIPVRAGLGLPVLLGFPTADAPVAAHDVPILSVGERPGVVLTPTGRFVGQLPDGWSSLSLETVLGVDDNLHMVAQAGAAALIGELKATAIATTAQQNGVVWPLPPDACWEQLTFDFRSDETVTVTFGGNSKTFEPVDLGMRSRKTNRPTIQWALLQIFAQQSGRLDFSGALIPAKVQKKKENLSKALRQAFGISVEPIPWSKGEHAFVCRFIIRCSIPVAAGRR